MDAIIYLNASDFVIINRLALQLKPSVKNKKPRQDPSLFTRGLYAAVTSEKRDPLRLMMLGIIATEL